MGNKTCGECEHYYTVSKKCPRNDVFELPKTQTACDYFEQDALAKVLAPKTNRDMLRQKAREKNEEAAIL